MHHGIEIGGVRLTLTNGQPVAYRTAAAAKEARLCIIGVLSISIGPATLLPQVSIVDLPTVQATNDPIDVPITNDDGPVRMLDPNSAWLVAETDTPDSPLPAMFKDLERGSPEWIAAGERLAEDRRELDAVVEPDPAEGRRSPLAAAIDPVNEKYYSDLMVLRSGAGWYIGTTYLHPDTSDTPQLLEPGTRDSFDYYRTEAEAQRALDTGTYIQRDHP